ncbi:MAG: hypothetical protein JRG71_02040 [Deltaproteobacteria bacterium]|nr:hypothetical protein [Deltaproteobacteria bacterium]
MARIVIATKKLLCDTICLYWQLIKIMVPVMILVRLCVEFGVIEVIGRVISPVMQLVGLPGEMGFVWVTAMVVNIYGGAAALITLLPQHPLTIAQATVLGSMILIAHSLPIEQRVAQKAGAGILFTTSLRIICALGYAMLLSVFYGGIEQFQQPAEVVFLSIHSAPQNWLPWALSSIKSLISIFWIILALLFGLKILDVLKITPLIAKGLSPFLRIMGIGEKATTMTMAGVLLGLSYGGALILKEARSGSLSDKDIFLSVSFMCLCHSLLEDTLFVMAFGGHYTGLLLGRLIFSLIVIMALARVIESIPALTFRRYLFNKFPSDPQCSQK